MSHSMNGDTSDETRKKEVKKVSTGLSPVLILETGFLLEWSVRGCPSVTFLASAHLSSLCGGELLGLRPYPLLIVHPVLTEAHTTGRRERSSDRQARNEGRVGGRARTSRSCTPQPVPGPECWARSAALGYPAGSEKSTRHPPVRGEVV